MAIWHPDSGVSYIKYLQTDSFVKDITGEIRTTGETISSKVSEQTKEIVASNDMLAYTFGSGFDTVSDTLNWGFNQLDNELRNVEASIESLRSDFNYGMGLLLAQAHTQNRLLSELLDKLDGIHKTLESPTLTQAREFYRIGCDRLARKLIDKALEAFILAEKKNDTDFFTQFQIGNLYLNGIDEDDNVVDLEKAKHHLLLAARFAKAEISLDSLFRDFAADALLKASFAAYFQLGEFDVTDNPDKARDLLNEAKKLALEAIGIYPHITESFYHLAKYHALLVEEEYAISNLEKAIVADRNYAIKCDIDGAFDSIRNKVFDLLIRLKKDKELESQNKITQAEKLIQELTIWHPEESLALNPLYEDFKYSLLKAVEHCQTKTYWGFLDAIPFAEIVINECPEIKLKRIEEIRSEIDKYFNSAKSKLQKNLVYGLYSEEVDKTIDEMNSLLSEVKSHLSKVSYDAYKMALSIAEAAYTKAIEGMKIIDREKSQEKILQQRKSKIEKYLNSAESSIRKKGEYSEKVDIAINETNKLLSEAKRHLRKVSYDSYNMAMSIAKAAVIKGKKAQQMIWRIDEERREKEKQERERRILQKRKNEYSEQYARGGAVIGFFIGGISGCVSCIVRSVPGTYTYSSDFIIGTVLGVIFFAVCGAIIGQMRS